MTLFEAILVLITGSVGLFGNCILIYWFFKLNRKLNFHYLMLTLAAYDTIYVLLCILVFAIPKLFQNYNTDVYYYYLVPKAIPIIQVALTGSIYCTGAISVERYLAVCRPFYTATENKWSAKRYIIPILIFSLIYNVPRFFEMRTQIIEVPSTTQLNITSINFNEDEAISTEKKTFPRMNVTINEALDETTENLGTASNALFTTDTTLTKGNIIYDLELTKLRNNKYYYSIYTIGLNLILMGICPFVLIITLNVLMYRELMRIIGDSPHTKSRSCSIISFTNNRDSTRRSIGNIINKRIKPSEILLAKVSLLIVAVFVFCHTIRWIPNIYELIQRLCTSDNIIDQIEWPSWVEYVTSISHFLIVFNASINFYIYYFNHKGIPACMCLRGNQQSSILEMSEPGRGATLLSDIEFH